MVESILNAETNNALRKIEEAERWKLKKYCSKREQFQHRRKNC